MPDLERADSVTVDPHKWFFQAYDIGGLLVRDGAHLAAVFGGRAPEYYRGGEGATPGAPATTDDHDDHDDHGDQLNFYKLSFEGTRRWRALKLWMTWKHLGTSGFGRLIEANDDLAALPRRALRGGRRLRGRCPPIPELSVVCFRHLPGGAAALTLAPALDAHQDRLQARSRRSGDGWLTTTRLRGATWLRAGIVNYLSTEDDIDRLLDTLRATRRRTSDPRKGSRCARLGLHQRDRALRLRRLLAWGCARRRVALATAARSCGSRPPLPSDRRRSRSRRSRSDTSLGRQAGRRSRRA